MHISELYDIAACQLCAAFQQLQSSNVCNVNAED